MKDGVGVAPDSGTGQQLVSAVYNDLHALARSYRRLTRGGTMGTTGLVHEVYLRLADNTWDSRAHFFAVAAKAMRQILADSARRRRRRVVGSGLRVTLSEAIAPCQGSLIDFVQLNDALSALSELDERKCNLLELRFLGGLTVQEIAEAQNLSISTVERDLRFARAWLLGRLNDGTEKK